MREAISKMAFFATSGFAVGFSPEIWTTIVTLAAIVLGWVWLESRMERIVKRELKSHTDVEEMWRKSVDDKIDTLLQKRRGD